MAIRLTACSEQQRTTMILLCEDGSLRIYMASVESTSYWLQPSLQPSSVISVMKPVRKRKAAATSKAPPPRPAGEGTRGGRPRTPGNRGAGPLPWPRFCTSSAGARVQPLAGQDLTCLVARQRKRWGLSC